MIKKYDFVKARKIIKNEEEKLERASLGMYEDWFWTAETIWENGEYVKDIPNDEEKFYDSENATIRDIQGSSWATPTLRLDYKDGNSIFYECYQGKSNGSKPFSGILGCLSKPVQDNMPSLKKYSKKLISNLPALCVLVWATGWVGLILMGILS